MTWSLPITLSTRQPCGSSSNTTMGAEAGAGLKAELKGGVPS